MKSLRFAVLGAGAGGQSMAAILAQQGHTVTLSDIDTEKINRLNELGKIVVTGKIEATGSPRLITSDIAAAVQDVDVIMVVTTTDGHKDVANKIAPHLKDGQIIILNPGHVGGAMEVAHIIRDIHGCKANLIIAETNDLMYACRVSEPGLPFHSGIKKKIGIATLPASDVDKLLDVLSTVFPCLVPAENVLETGFVGSGAMLHPIPSFMNIVRLDNNQPYDYYMEGITPSVAKLVTRADEERLAVCKALGLNIPSLLETLQQMYNLPHEDLYQLLQHNKAYVGVKSPNGLNHRFMVEDVTCGLVPLTSVGEELGVATPMMDAFIEIASAVSMRDFRMEGRTAENLGLAGKTVEQIYELIS